MSATIVNEYLVPVGMIWHVIRTEEDERANRRIVFRNGRMVHQGELTTGLDLAIPIYDELRYRVGDARLLIKKYGNEYFPSIRMGGKSLESVRNEHKKRFSSWRVPLVNVLIKPEPEPYFIVWDEIHKRLWFDGRPVDMRYNSSGTIKFERCREKFTLKKGSHTKKIRSVLENTTKGVIVELFNGN